MRFDKEDVDVIPLGCRTLLVTCKCMRGYSLAAYVRVLNKPAE